MLGRKLNSMTYKLPDELQKDVQAALEDWRKEGKVRRLWAADASLWTEADEANWLGWLEIVDKQLKGIAHLQDFADDVKRSGFTRCAAARHGRLEPRPEVFARDFRLQAGLSRSCTCSTRPTRRRSGTSKLASISDGHCSWCRANPAARSNPTSSSNTSYERAKQTVGAAEAPKRFVAVTDPGSSLEKAARNEGFRCVFHGLPSIGGRYSVLSDFGMVPAAAIGIDPRAFLENTAEMVRSCAASAPPVENPGVILGAILGTAQRRGRDKVTIIASRASPISAPGSSSFLPNSTGKLGKGIVPVDAEPLGAAGGLRQ